MRRFLVAILAAETILAAPITASAKDAVYQSFFGTAINGTDPVAYFPMGKPVEGSSDFAHDWNGATFHFASAENRDLFAASPEKYAPQFGGYCAWAVSQGYTASTDLDAWKIVDGKLYLNYRKSVQSQWEQDIPGNISAGEGNWPKVLN